MTLTMPVGQVAAVALFPGDASGNVTQATLSKSTLLGNDDATFTVAPDPNNPNGCLVTGISAGTGQIAALSTFLDTNGATGQVAGTITVEITAVVGPTPITTQLLVLSGTPVPIGQPVPPVPPPAPVPSPK